MIYQETFQNGENVREVNVSVRRYTDLKPGGFPCHCHSYYELEWMLEGGRTLYYNGETFELPRDGLTFIPLLTPHGIAAREGPTQNIILQFSQEFLYKNAGSFPQSSVLMPDGEMLRNHFVPLDQEETLLQIIRKITLLAPACRIPDGEAPAELLLFPVSYDPIMEWKLNGLMLDLLTRLLDSGYLKIVADTGNSMEISRIQPVLNQLIAHPENHLSMQEAARLACVSYSNFSRIFKTLTGLSYVDYCNITRIRHAETLLAESRLSVAEIAQQLRFGTQSYFNRIFKKFNGHTPLEYRAALEQKRQKISKSD